MADFSSGDLIERAFFSVMNLDGLLDEDASPLPLVGATGGPC
jgi:hypothetical protein